MISTDSFLLSLLMLMMTLALAGAVSQRPGPVVLRSHLEALPKEIGTYRGEDDVFPEAVNRILDADVQVYRHYQSDQSHPRDLDLYIGYYGTEKGGRTGHNPYACLPGAGWAIVDSRRVGIRPAGGQEVTVNYLQARKNGINAVMMHWYQTAGTTVMATGLQQNIERFWGRLFRNRNDGAYVQIVVQVPDDGVAAAVARIEAFSAEILQLLPRYWPVEGVIPSETVSAPEGSLKTREAVSVPVDGAT